ncbi:MAG: cytochrome b/b6 domain-containing protein, partial [Chloroflexi bacterium]|nr:cytochrome b/b6 domain-containing protein [Chloroflexota bacterium]
MSEQYVSLSEQKRLRNKSVKKHAIANILTHWFNVAMWSLLLPTGLAILASPRLGIAPELWQTALRNLFGGTANLIKFHYSVGLLWMFVLTYNILIGFRKYFIPFTVQRMAMDKDDVNWLMMKGLQIIGKRGRLQRRAKGVCLRRRSRLVLHRPDRRDYDLLEVYSGRDALDRAMVAPNPLRLGRRDRRRAVHPRLYGRGVPRRARGLLLDVLRQSQRVVRQAASPQVVSAEGRR